MAAALRDESHRTRQAAILLGYLFQAYPGCKQAPAVYADDMTIGPFGFFHKSAFQIQPLLLAGFPKSRGKKVDGTNLFENAVVKDSGGQGPGSGYNDQIQRMGNI